MSTLIDTICLMEKCQKELSEYDDAVADNKSRTILHDDTIITITHKQSGRTEFAAYTPELYRVLSTPSICSYAYDYKKRRIMVEVMKKQRTGKRWRGILGHFIYLFNHRKNNLSDFLCNVPKRTGKTTDHANDDTRNHCGWNLSEMTARENLQKGTYLSRIKPPYYCYVAVDDSNRYRIHYGYCNEWKRGQSFYILCETPELLNHFLRAASSVKEAPAFLRRSESIFNLWKAGKAAPYAALEYYSAAREAKEMLGMDLSDFEKWTVDSMIVCDRAGRRSIKES